MRKFSRKTDQRRAFLKGLAASLIKNEKIKTTEARAKELRPFVERLVTYAKQGDLAGRRRVSGFLSAPVARKLAKEIAPQFKERNGGYTRITKIGRRMSDGSSMVYIEFVK